MSEVASTKAVAGGEDSLPVDSFREGKLVDRENR